MAVIFAAFMLTSSSNAMTLPESIRENRVAVISGGEVDQVADKKSQVPCFFRLHWPGPSSCAALRERGHEGCRC